MTQPAFACEEEKLVEHTLRIFRFVCGPLADAPALLDLGCGSGQIVCEFRKRGLNASGVDFDLPAEGMLRELGADSFRRIEEKPYRIPFDNQSFDFVFSNEVLEHVSDHRPVFAEMARVLKPGGVGLHYFPPKYAPLEVHTRVPLGGVFQQYPYLLFWALLGIRNQFQKQMRPIETARFNRRWLKANTNYKSRRALIQSAKPYFSEIRFLDRDFLRLSPGRPGRYYPAFRFIPFLPRIYSGLRKRALFLKKAW